MSRSLSHLRQSRTSPTPTVHRTGRVWRLYVLPAHRRSGIGQALLEAVMTHARDHFDLLRVRTEATGEFYTARGFRREDSDAEATHILESLDAA